MTLSKFMSTIKLFSKIFLKITLFCTIAENKNFKFFQQSKMVKNTGVEELGHLEMVGTLVYQLSDGASGKDWLEGHTPEYYADNGNAVFP